MSTATQKIDVPCPQCKRKLAVPVSAMGKSGKCPHCQTVFPLAMPALRPTAPYMAMAAASPLTPLSPVTPAPYAASGFTAQGGPDLMPLGDADLMPLSDAGLTPLPASRQMASLGGGNPFGETMPQGEYTLQPMAPAPYVATTTLPSNSSMAAEHLAAANMAIEESRSRRHYGNNGEGWGINAGIGGGALLMLGAVVWFVAGLIFFDFIFFYPPVMFIIGLIAFFKGIADNFSE